MDSLISKEHKHEVKHKQVCPIFEIRSLIFISYIMTIILVLYIDPQPSRQSRDASV